MNIWSLGDVTRIDIDGSEHWADQWRLSIQDDGRTLKFFRTGSGTGAKALRDQALAEFISEHQSEGTP